VTDQNGQWLVEAIEAARHELDFDPWAWVFMPDHVHLIVRPRRDVYDMAAIRRRIKEPVAKRVLAWIREHAPEWLPRLQRQRGTRTETLFWQSGGGYDRNITEPATLLKMVDYIHENPVRKRLVTRAWEWPWSSAAWYVSQQPVALLPDVIPPEWTNE
jgi:putative transposase